MKDTNVEKVVTQLRERKEKGLQKYGVTTDRIDLSTLEWLQHLQEELMDGAVYIEKIKSEINEKNSEKRRKKKRVQHKKRSNGVE
tara:strand:+ start:489 stop:743 length:255 start_codon:yes stop_codon:yes gene_type:complete